MITILLKLHFLDHSFNECYIITYFVFYALFPLEEIILKFGAVFSLFLKYCYFDFSKVPAYLNIVDIAGLVKGASEGQGLGNAFLSHISACDAIFHLCRK